MKRTENQAPAGVVEYNYQRSKASLPKAEDLETLVPAKVMEELINGDPEPYFKIEAIDFPAKGSGGVYDKSFFKSFLGVMKNRPIPGSKRGHEYTSRPSSDFYTVGGRLEENADGKTGTVFFKIYIPKQGDTTDNAGFIRDARANIVNFSLVTAPDYKVVTDKDEAGNPVQVRHYTASMGYERNDAVEYGAGAMAQTVNSATMPFDFDAARALIEAGEFDTQSNVEGEPIRNGRVYRSALRRLASRANEEDRSAIGELLSLIDKATNGRKTVNTKEEAIEVLGNALANSQITKADIAKTLGIEVRNESDIANAEFVKAINEKLGDKPLEQVDALIAENKKTAEDRVKNAVAEAFGPAEVENLKKEKVPNAMHVRALELCKGKSGEELKNAIEAAKKDPIMLELAAARADGNSSINRIVTGGKTANENSTRADGIPVIRVGKKE